MNTYLVDKGDSVINMNYTDILTLINKNIEELKDGYIEDYKGFQLKVMSNDVIGNLCGYIIGNTDDLYNIHEEGDVHGGWTFISIDNNYHYDMPSLEDIHDEFGSDAKVFIGFDCAHINDLCLYDVKSEERDIKDKSYKDKGFVLKELKRVVDEYLTKEE